MITGPGRILIAAALLARAVPVPAAPAVHARPVHSHPAQAARPTLTGQVVDETGKAVPGARVSVYEAGVKKGYSPFCPSCYPDCGKSVRANTQGKFQIASLDPQLRFRLLIVADGYAPSFAEKIDPAASPVTLTLTPRREDVSDSAHVVSGQVVGPDGLPIAGAEVEPFGMIVSPDMTTFSDGDYLGVDALAITDAGGRFALYTKTPRATFYAKVTARGQAAQVTHSLSADGAVHTITMSNGASVFGRVVQASKPVPGVLVGLVQVDKNSETFVGHTEIGTDSKGRFVLSNVSPNTDYYVYGLMGGAGRTAATLVHRIHVGADNAEVNAGDLTVPPLHQLTGQLVLTDGKPVPPMTRVLLSRQGAWDSKIVMADAQGRFVAKDLPDETLHFSVFIPGYRFSYGDVGFDPRERPQGLSLHLPAKTTQVTARLFPINNKH